MRILEVNKYLYLRRGAEKYLLDLIELLQGAGHQVRLFGMEHPENVPLAKQENLPAFVGYHGHDSSLWQRVKGGARIFWSFEVTRKFRELLKEWQPDIIHIHNIYHQLSFSLLREARKQGIPIVMTVHDYACISPDKDEYHFTIKKKYWKFLQVKKYSFGKRILLILRAYWEEWLGGYQAFVDMFLVPSQVVRGALIHAGVPAGKIVVLPHFIAVPQEPNFSKAAQGNYLLTLSGASIEKNTSWLENFCEENEIPLIICGQVEEGYQKSTSPLVTYAGQKTQKELAEYWRGAKAGVSSSLLPETFGLVALESLSWGKPFFCFDTGAYKEIVRTGQDGVVAKTEEELKAALKNLWTNEVTYDGESIQKSAAERFSKKQHLQTLEQVFQKVSKSD